jgi:hypothetical protein
MHCVPRDCGVGDQQVSEYITSGSAFERLAICPTSAALPRASHESIYSERGNAIHSFIEAVVAIGRDAALLTVPDDWRSTCERLNLEGLDEHLNLIAEVALAYDVSHDTARELGRGAGRAYHDVTIDELPATLDIVGVRVLPDGRKRGFVVDWKTGWTTRKKISNVQQLDVGALLVARAYGCDVVEVQLIHVFEDKEPWVQRRVIEGFEIDLFAATVADVYRAAMLQRDRFEQKIPAKEFNTGAWCDGCNSREFCPAQVSLVRGALVSPDEYDGVLRDPLGLDTMSDAQIAKLLDDVERAQSVLSIVKKRIYGLASARTIRLGPADDGTADEFLGRVQYQGRDFVDGEIAFDVLATLHDEEVATKATKVVATKGDIDAAIMSASKPRKGAENKRKFYAALKEAGGIRSEWKETVKRFTRPKLLEGTAKPPIDVQEPQK